MRSMKKGQVREATGLLIFAVTLIVGLLIFGQFETSALATLPTTSSGTASVANLSSNYYSGTNIASVGPLVMAGAAILAAVALIRR